MFKPKLKMSQSKMNKSVMDIINTMKSVFKPMFKHSISNHNIKLKTSMKKFIKSKLVQKSLKVARLTKTSMSNINNNKSKSQMFHKFKTNLW